MLRLRLLLVVLCLSVPSLPASAQGSGASRVIAACKNFPADMQPGNTEEDLLDFTECITFVRGFLAGAEAEGALHGPNKIQGFKKWLGWCTGPRATLGQEALVFK